MKRYLFLFITTLLVITGCGKTNINNVIKHFSDDVSNAKSYKLIGKLKLISDEEEFNYHFNVSYLDDEYYMVNLLNTNNNHEQVILKNDDGVYVITPELNKSFKFQSSWPHNSSQSYLLSSLLKDINNDNNAKLDKYKHGYILTTKVNYPNNDEFISQKIYFNKKLDLEKVVVYDKDNKERIVTNFTKIDLKANVSKDTFEIDNYIKEIDEDSCADKTCEEKTLSIIDDIIYPLYLPNNTYLTSSEKIGENGNRVILTFSGDKNFTIVEESVQVPASFEIMPVYGDPVLLNDTYGVMGDNSVRWNRGNVSYFITGNNLTSTELASIASSMNYSVSVIGSK